MAFNSRNSILSLFTIVAMALAVIFCVNVVVFLFFVPGNNVIVFFSTQLFWFIYDTSHYSFLWSILGAVFLSITGIISIFIFGNLFKKVGQAEIFFFSLFLFSLVPELLRLAVITLHALDFPVVLGAMGTRIVILSRVFGILCLFFGGLHALEFRYQKLEVVVSVIFASALLFAFTIPLESGILLSNGLFKLGDEQGMSIIYFSIAFLTILSYAIALARGKFPIISLGIILSLLARELVFFTFSPILLAIAGICFIVGLCLVYKGYESHFSIN